MTATPLLPRSLAWDSWMCPPAELQAAVRELRSIRPLACELSPGDRLILLISPRPRRLRTCLTPSTPPAPAFWPRLMSQEAASTCELEFLAPTSVLAKTAAPPRRNLASGQFRSAL